MGLKELGSGLQGWGWGVWSVYLGLVWGQVFVAKGGIVSDIGQPVPRLGVAVKSDRSLVPEGGEGAVSHPEARTDRTGQCALAEQAGPGSVALGGG